MNTTEIGNRAESKVIDFLCNKDFKIISRNWRTKFCEIDIIAQRQDVVYFVEVKYRSSSSNGDGLDYITRDKLSRMVRAANLWVVKNNWQGCYELSVASITGKNMNVNFIETID